MRRFIYDKIYTQCCSFGEDVVSFRFELGGSHREVILICLRKLKAELLKQQKRVLETVGLARRFPASRPAQHQSQHTVDL
jgi:hypothetical protein